MDTNWTEYKCKSGQTLFIYNKATGEHKWPSDGSTADNCVMIGQPVVYKEVCTIGTQTDDNGCNNGCTSIYINTDHVINITQTSPLQEPVVLKVARDDIDIEPGLDNGLDNGGREEISMEDITNNTETPSKETGELDEVTDKSVLEETCEDSFDGDGAQPTDEPVNINANDEFEEEVGKSTKHAVQNTKTSNEARFRCRYCYKRYNDDFRFQRHLKSHEHGPSECSYCKRTFFRQYDLKRHMKTHTGEKPFQCPQCKKKFAQREHLKNHARLHTGERPFECSYCKKKFAQKAVLTAHLKRHSERTFECSYCSKKFFKKQDIERHLKVHTKEKPFECSFCKKKFATKEYLKYHEKTHTGEKPYECSHCKKKFPRKENLDFHERMHTGEKPFECSYCNKKYARKQRLEYHLKTHASEKSWGGPHGK
ncbi:oocyte zinc finger protein XlCOF6.1 [Exaiptasia diaphana]|uniref:C2H2-type domain-containing protein n=1 Tax=Exaiptasia diaphana TaxID=2652724 RepID=A0A913X704_EXADI|nr:oocyte zinc finger protein XlCOF6.1 [Exaiptasia diaphana]KXJ14589.1 Gastrula zinc finger protein XlCGF57.1 [Exaiptasia diaphana]